jgi:hypothetical protein
MLRALLPRFLLIIVLLFAQLGGLAHGISHSMDAHSSDSALSHDKHCDLCELYAQIDSSVGATALSFHAATQHNEFYAVLLNGYSTNHFHAYTARAPPYTL